MKRVINLLCLSLSFSLPIIGGGDRAGASSSSERDIQATAEASTDGESRASRSHILETLNLRDDELGDVLRHMLVNQQGQISDIRKQLEVLREARPDKTSEFNPDQNNLDTELADMLLETVPDTLKRKIAQLRHIGEEPVIPRKKKKGHKLFLLGAPGVGKTSLAYAIGKKFGYPVEYHVASSVPNKYRYSGENRFKKILEKYEHITTPHILFLDEFPELFRINDKANGDEKRIASTFWAYLDRCLQNENFIFIAVGNDAEELPDPIKDRFHGAIYKLVLPDHTMRVRILNYYIPSDQMGDCDINKIANWTKGYSSRELEELVENATGCANERLEKVTLKIGLCSYLRSYLPRMFYGMYIPTQVRKLSMYDFEQALSFVSETRYTSGRAKSWPCWSLERLDAFGKNEHVRFYLWPVTQMALQLGINYGFARWNMKFQETQQLDSQKFQQKLHDETRADFLSTAFIGIMSNPLPGISTAEREKAYANLIKVWWSKYDIINKQFRLRYKNDPLSTLSV